MGNLYPITVHPILESWMNRKVHVQFGGGIVEKRINCGSPLYLPYSPYPRRCFCDHFHSLRINVTSHPAGFSMLSRRCSAANPRFR